MLTLTWRNNNLFKPNSEIPVASVTYVKERKYWVARVNNDWATLHSRKLAKRVVERHLDTRSIGLFGVDDIEFVS